MVDTPEGMSPMEAAGLIHAESGDIADVVTKMALADGKNVIFDITMTTSGSVTGRIKKAKAHGYDEFTGVYIDVPLEVSLKSAQERYIRGAQEYTDGVRLRWALRPRIRNHASTSTRIGQNTKPPGIRRTNRVQGVHSNRNLGQQPPRQKRQPPTSRPYRKDNH
ncbi:zeta toxin family protein [Corynebacterium ulcerans]|nr:zeta toxin family protein [Corynebacterium ulcerans]